MSDSYGNMVVSFSENFKGNKEKIVEYMNNHLFCINGGAKINDSGMIVIGSQLDGGTIQYPNLDFERNLEDGEEGDDDIVRIGGDDVVKQLKEFIDEGVLYFSTTSTDKFKGNDFEYLKIDVDNDVFETYSFNSYIGSEPTFNHYTNEEGRYIDRDLISGENY